MPLKMSDDANKPIGKVKAKRQTRPHDADVFRIAAALLNLTPANDCTRFNVTRQTLAAWIHGDTSAPRSAYVLLLDEVLKAIDAGTVNLAAARDAKYERIAPALKLTRTKENEK